MQKRGVGKERKRKRGVQQRGVAETKSKRQGKEKRRAEKRVQSRRGVQTRYSLLQQRRCTAAFFCRHSPEGADEVLFGFSIGIANTNTNEHANKTFKRFSHSAVGAVW